QEGGTALDALIDAAAGILAADSLEDTLGRIAHHLQALLPYDDLTVYEVDAEGTGLHPVFAMGSWVEEIMAETLSVNEGTTAWAGSSTTAAPRSGCAARSSRPPRPGARSASWSSTSITSSASTTRSDTPRATRRSPPPRPSCARSSARAMPSAGSAARSS